MTSDAQLSDEIVGSRDELEQTLGTKIRHFAFPYGLRENLSPAAIRIAAQAGFDGVCSAYGGYNHPGDDAFHLQRIHADPEFVRLKNWLTVDPRKVRRGERYAYEHFHSDYDHKEAAQH
jgi:peptidoglycan/xylan/chitin deacetylase (PgdA/CDA1 family)